jgi:hypothetical protein
VSREWEQLFFEGVFMLDNPFGKKLEIQKVIEMNENDKAEIWNFYSSSVKNRSDIVKPLEIKKEEVIEGESEHAKILRAYGGLESNIPIDNQYWRIRP